MNNARRVAIAKLIERADELRTLADSLKGDIESLKDEETEYKENMPESLADGEKGQKADAAIDALESAYSAMDDIDSSLSEVSDYLNAAAE